MYDLTLIPIHTQQGQPLEQLSGFRAASPPKRPARSRSEDLLILSLIIHGDTSVSANIQAGWLDRLSQVFFKTSGSVTSALRSLIETLNLTLMEKNLKLAQDGGWTTGAINLVAIHRRSLYIAQSGLTHAFTLTHAGLQHFQDPANSDRGLGLSRTPAIRYFQADLGTGGYLFMTDSPLDTWREDTLLMDGFPSQENLRRRLLNQAPVNFRLDLVQIRPGEGQINTMVPAAHGDKRTVDPAPSSPPDLPGGEPPESPAPESTTPAVDQQDTQKVHTMADSENKRYSVPDVEDDDIRGFEGQGALDAEGVFPPSETTSDGNEEMAEPVAPSPSSSSMEPPAPQPARQTPSKKPQLQNASAVIREEGLRGLASFFDWWHATWNKVGGFFKDFVARFSQEGDQQPAEISRGALLWIAVLAPIFVVAIALGVYISRGQQTQYEYFLNQAQSAVQSALAADDPVVERSAWNEALNLLDQAEDIRNTDDVASLRQEAQNALDILDGALRLAYQPALQDTLSSEINITEIVSYGRDLYLFDEASGWVIHAMRGDDIFTVNTDFLCAPGNYSGGALGAIVDMVSLPINNTYQAHLLVIDEIGNVAYCSPGQDPIVQTLPETGGGTSESLSIAYENNSLYVLRPSLNSILVYSATNGQFFEPPQNYFNGAASQQIPDLTTAVDLDVNGPSLYLLRGDGSLVSCVYSGLPDNPVTCETPVQYLDGRPGLEDQTLVLPEGQFSTVFHTPPPTPLVNILDATHGEVYRFSLRFRLYQRLRPELGDYEVNRTTASAFTIGEIEPLAFIAFGNQVFFAYVD